MDLRLPSMLWRLLLGIRPVDRILRCMMRPFNVMRRFIGPNGRVIEVVQGLPIEITSGSLVFGKVENRGKVCKGWMNTAHK